MSGVLNEIMQHHIYLFEQVWDKQAQSEAEETATHPHAVTQSLLSVDSSAGERRPNLAGLWRECWRHIWQGRGTCLLYQYESECLSKSTKLNDNISTSYKFILSH